MRKCIDCGVEKALDEFPVITGKKAGGRQRHTYCADCQKVRKNAYYRSAGRNSYYLRRYGITVEQMEAMLAAQDGKCAICASPDPKGHNWCVDHDHACCEGKSHSCGKCIRGVLCLHCNTALGMFEDDMDRLINAVHYLNQAGVSRMTPAGN